MRRIRVIAVAATALVAVAFVASSASAVTQPVPKATGGIAMSGPMQYASFNAFDYGATGDRGSVTYTNFEYAVPGTGVWMMGAGPSKLDVIYGTDYFHTMFIDHVVARSPSATSFTGHGSYDGPEGYEWTIKGSVSGSKVSFAITYTTGTPGYVFTATGTIASDGSMSGTATDTLGQAPLTWTLEPGTAHEVFSYTAPVTNVVVTGNTATFDFTIPAGLPYAGTVVNARVTDGGSPGAGHDTWEHGVGGGYANYPIVGGNLVVH